MEANESHSSPGGGCDPAAQTVSEYTHNGRTEEDHAHGEGCNPCWREKEQRDIGVTVMSNAAAATSGLLWPFQGDADIPNGMQKEMRYETDLKYGFWIWTSQFCKRRQGCQARYVLLGIEMLEFRGGGELG